jgi:hypothetical protein
MGAAPEETRQEAAISHRNISLAGGGGSLALTTLQRLKRPCACVRRRHAVRQNFGARELRGGKTRFCTATCSRRTADSVGHEQTEASKTGQQGVAPPYLDAGRRS